MTSGLREVRKFLPVLLFGALSTSVSASTVTFGELGVVRTCLAQSDVLGTNVNLSAISAGDSLIGLDSFTDSPANFVANAVGNCTTGGGCTPLSSCGVADVSVTVPNAATFNVSCAGSAPTAYQWQVCSSNCGVEASWSVAPGASTSASYTFSPTALGDSGKKFRVQVSNSCPSSAVSNQALLTVTNPVTPSVAITSPSDGFVINLANQNAVSVTGTCNLSGTTVALTVGAISLGTPTCNGSTFSGTFNFSSVSEGAITLTATHSSATATRSLFKDSIAPSLSISSPAAGTIIHSGTVSSTAMSGFCSELNQPVTIKFGALVVGSANCISGSFTTSNLNLSSVPQGDFTLIAEHSDVSGNPATASRSLNLDTVGPVLSSLFPASGTTISGVAQVLRVNAADSHGVNNVKFYLNGVLVGTATTPTSGTTYQVTIDTTSFANGTYNYYASAQDATGGLNQSQTSTSGYTLSVSNFAPTISAQPSNQDVSQGSSAVFTVTASGAGTLAYQWQESADGGLTWGAPAGGSGASTSTYTVTGVRAVNHNHQFRVIVSNPLQTISSAATLTVGIPPQVTGGLVGPTSALVEGSTANFSVSATATPGPHYAWERSTDGGASYAAAPGSADQSTYSVGGLTLGQNGHCYRVNVTNGYLPNAVAGPICISVIPAPISVTISPAPVLNAVQDQVKTLTSSVTGTGPFTYQWQRSIDSGASWNPVTAGDTDIVGGITNPSLSIKANRSTNHNNMFRVSVSNGTSSAISNDSTLQVLLFIITQPVDNDVTEGSGLPVSFSVVAGPLPGPFTYQWEVASSESGPFANASGDSNYSSYVIANPTYAQDNNKYYRVAVSNAFGTIYSRAAHLIVNPPACLAPSMPTLINPAAGAVNVAPDTNFTWNAVTTQPYCTISYDIRVARDGSGNCASADYSVQGLAGTSYLPPSLLLPATNYYWCVRAVASNTSSSAAGSWAQSNFTTRTEVVPAPNNLYTLPPTTAEHPLGNQWIVVGALNGIANATGRFYLQTASGLIEVGSSPVYSGGRFEIAVNVTQFGAGLLSGPRVFYARQQVGSVLSALSLPVTYYYDASAANQLFPPVLMKGTGGTGSLQWNQSAGATHYNVYRRVGILIPTANLYKNAKPFEKVATVPTSAGMIQWMDPAVPTLDGHGVSYFVTAVVMSGMTVVQESARSNSQSFEDSIGPKRSEEHFPGGGPYKQQIEWVSEINGSSARGQLCNLLTGTTYFHGLVGPIENHFYEASPDMVAFVQVKPKAPTVSCADEDFDAGSQSVSLPFDAIETFTDPSRGADNCIDIGSLTNLPVNQQVCIKACIRDLSNNNESPCLERGRSFTFTPFPGISAATALDDGTSVKVEWSQPTAPDGSMVQLPQSYFVQLTDEFDSDSNPVFTDNSPGYDVSGSETQKVVPNLKSNQKYCFKVIARDGQVVPNEGGENKILCATTLNNYPQVTDIGIGRDERQPQLVNITFKPIDRQANPVQIVNVSYRFSGVDDYHSIDSVSLSGNSQEFLASGDALESAPQYAITFDTLAYFSGQRDGFQIKLDYIDSQGLQGTSESAPLTAYYSASRVSSYQRSAAAGIGCGSLTMDGSTRPWVALALGVLALMAALFCRRNIAWHKRRGA